MICIVMISISEILASSTPTESRINWGVKLPFLALEDISPVYGLTTSPDHLPQMEEIDGKVTFIPFVYEEDLITDLASESTTIQRLQANLYQRARVAQATEISVYVKKGPTAIYRTIPNELSKVQNSVSIYGRDGMYFVGSALIVGVEYNDDSQHKFIFDIQANIFISLEENDDSEGNQFRFAITEGPQIELPVELVNSMFP